MLNKIKAICSTIAHPLDTFDRFIYDRKLLVYGDWKQKAISQVVISTLGAIFGLWLGSVIISLLF